MSDTPLTDAVMTIRHNGRLVRSSAPIYAELEDLCRTLERKFQAESSISAWRAERIAQLEREICKILTKQNDEDNDLADEVERLTIALSEGTSRWIPLGEQLPGSEWRGQVLASDGKRVFVESTHPSWWNHKDERGREHDGPTVTHWMPLPEAPK